MKEYMIGDIKDLLAKYKDMFNNMSKNERIVYRHLYRSIKYYESLKK